MSHFTVLVIGKNPEEQLAPFHEFECTGHDDQYVQDIEQTEKLRQEYEKHTESRLRDARGVLYSPYDDQFYREPLPGENVGMGDGYHGEVSYTNKDWGDGKGYRPKVKFVPKGFEEVELSAKEIMTFAEFLEDWHGKKTVRHDQQLDLGKEHKYGYALLNASGDVIKVIDRTNPNRKWDWYVLGGRWSGFFRLKNGGAGQLGRHGVFDRAPKSERHVDSAMIKDIDFTGMMDDAEAEASHRWDIIAEACGGDIPKITLSWESALATEGLDINQKRDLFWQQPAMLAFREAQRKSHENTSLSKEDQEIIIWADLAHYQSSREYYLQLARSKAILTFAVLKDGQWHERGSMGWWGSVSNEKEDGQWESQYRDLIASLLEDTVLSVYDCHI